MSDVSGDVSMEAIREEVREVCAAFPDVYWREHDAARRYPEEFLRAMLDSGWLSVLIPTEYGGKGLGITEASAVVETISRSGGNAANCHAQIYNSGMLVRHGSDELKRRYLPRIASGELSLIAFALTEHNAGLDTTRLETEAVRQGDTYVVNGHKNWLSRIQHSDLMILAARTSPYQGGAERAAGLSAFLVELPADLAAAGIDAKPVPTMLNLETNEVTFRDLRVPAENIIGEEGEAFRYLIHGVNGDRIAAASAAIGDSRWFLERASSYASEREVFGRPIGQNQGIQFPLARAYAATEAASLMRFRAAELYDAGEKCAAEANMAKLLASEASWDAANAAMNTLGGYGFASEYDVERKFRETRLFINGPGSNQLLLSYLGQHVLGMPRSF